VRDETLHKLGERVKELTALHRTARLLQDNQRTSADIIRDVVLLLPMAWQYPDVTAARIRFRELDLSTSNYAETRWVQSATFATSSKETGSIEICYLAEKPQEAEGPFLAEERELIESLAEMLRSFFQHRLADDALREAHDNLECQVRERTADLRRTNEALQEQLAELQRAQQQITSYQEQLRKLNSELSLAEARERRAIASDLHDHIGQALAFIRLRVTEFQGNAVFCGFEGSIDEILSLLDKTIQYTRNLTFEISPPILYELGLEAAIEWLAEQFERKHGFRARVVSSSGSKALREEVQVVLFKCVHELLTNVVKHAAAKKITITMTSRDGRFSVKVADDGVGISSGPPNSISSAGNAFGLFSIKERMRYLAGDFVISSRSGKGTSVTLEVPC
jgi:signal transduction histidine kinase